ALTITTCQHLYPACMIVRYLLYFATSSRLSFSLFYLFFFFNDTATTEIYTLSLHDALPISVLQGDQRLSAAGLTNKGDLCGRETGRELRDAERSDSESVQQFEIREYCIFGGFGVRRGDLVRRQGQALERDFRLAKQSV